MKKKNKSWFYRNQNWALPLIMIIIIISLVFFIPDKNRKFNPEKDICTEWQLKYFNRDEGNVIDHYSSCFQCEDRDCPHYSEPFASLNCNEHCSDWRSKTKCELNPEAEGCICDEWKDNVVGYNPSVDVIEYRNLTDFILRNISCEDIIYTFSLDNHYVQTGDYTYYILAMKLNATTYGISCSYYTAKPIFEHICIKSHEPVCESTMPIKWAGKISRTMTLGPQHSKSIGYDYGDEVYFTNITINRVYREFECLKNCTDTNQCVFEKAVCTEDIAGKENIEIEDIRGIIYNNNDYEVKISISFIEGYSHEEEVCK